MQDAKLVAMEENLRSEVRKESLHHLNDVTSMFLQQLTRNKVAHANVQTMSEDLPQPRKEMAVQVRHAARQGVASLCSFHSRAIRV